MKCRDCEQCAYCGQPLAGKHDHDHMPVPFRAGGDTCVPACENCHSLKDRKPWHEWDTSAAVQAYAEIGPLGRILMAHLVGRWHIDGDLKQRLDTLRDAVEAALEDGDVDALRAAVEQSRERPVAERSRARLVDGELRLDHVADADFQRVGRCSWAP